MARRPGTRTVPTSPAASAGAHMANARENPQTTNASVDAIAGRVGYSSEYAFGKAFKRELGLPPARYRRERRAAAEANSA
ncbi:MAG: helix-turn-helix domain-containing protein [Solirubrobacteraceae bacterium]